MIYDFDEIIERSNTNSAKYDERKKKFGKEDVIPLWVADMDFRVPKEVTDALIKCANHGIFGYVSRPDSYFDAFCEWQSKRNGWIMDKNLLAFCVGIVPALSAIVHEFSGAGDAVLIQPPVYAEFFEVIKAWDRVTVENKLLLGSDGKYTVDFDDFEKKVKEYKPSLFILCNPHNPVGRVWSREELMRMCNICMENDVLIVADEIHSDLLLWGNKHIPAATLSDEIKANTITCISATKTFNLAGLQAGTVVFPNKIYKDTFNRYWMKMDIHRNNSFSVVAVEAALRYGENWLIQLISYIENNIMFVHDFCKTNIPEIKPNLPESTYLLWLDCRDLNLEGKELNKFMVEKAGLGMNDGAAFEEGLSGFMRMNVACPRSVLVKALKQLKDAVENIKH